MAAFLSRLINRTSMERGDTLVEVVISLAILSALLASSFAVSSAAFRLGVGARERSQATNLVQQQAERLRSLRDNDLAGGGWDAFLTDIGLAGSRGCTTTCPTAPSAVSFYVDNIGGVLKTQTGTMVSAQPYQVTVRAHYKAANQPDLIVFDILVNWNGQSGSGNKADGTTSLANLTGIDPLVGNPSVADALVYTCSSGCGGVDICAEAPGPCGLNAYRWDYDLLNQSVNPPGLIAQCDWEIDGANGYHRSVIGPPTFANACKFGETLSNTMPVPPGYNVAADTYLGQPFPIGCQRQNGSFTLTVTLTNGASKSFPTSGSQGFAYPLCY